MSYSNISHDILTGLISKYDKNIPRYTSYPTVPEWSKDINVNLWHEYINTFNNSAPEYSLYFHIPFCRSACYYCACNIIVSPNGKLTEPYLNTLKKEIDLYSRHIAPHKVVKQMHFGGGTPTYLTPAQLYDILDYISQKFCLTDAPDREYSIEVDPRVTTKEQLDILRKFGFNRISMGVQDFDPIVQEAINRIQPYDMVKDLIDYARHIGFESINLDLIYGLPHQSLESSADSIKKVITLSPDRVALFNYAHLPSLRPFQKAYIKEADLPQKSEKINIFLQAIEMFLAEHYAYMGLDHFAKETDDIAIAYRNNAMHRNFQGYTIRGELDMLSLGITSISDFCGMYAQNTKSINEYQAHFEQDTDYPPLERICAMSDDDILRRRIIQDILCHEHIDISAYPGDWSKELLVLQDMSADNLLQISGTKIRVLPLGKLFLRNIASVFDAYLGKGQQRMFSRTV